MSKLTWLRGTTYLSQYIYHIGVSPFSYFGFPDTTGSFKITVKGNDSIYIPSNGNVGIGITEPSQKLDVNGTARFRTTTYFNGQVYIDAVIYHDGDNSHFGFPQNDAFKIHVNGSDRLYINRLEM